MSQRSISVEANAARGYPVARDAPTLSELATQNLRDAILQLRLKPGERLVERDLAQQEGVSRTCIRAALLHLASEGLIERSPRGVLSVAAVSADEARQIYEVRAALESAMARQFVARASAADQRALADAAAHVEGAVGRSATSDYVVALGAFYDVLLRGSGNEVARRFLAMLHARITYLRLLTADRATKERETRTAKLMRGIQQAAAARDAELMAKRCEAFVVRSARFALQVLAETRITPQPAPATEQAARSMRAAPPRQAGARSRGNARATGQARNT
jgi:GntR family transcriptional regulator, trigonelline degradation regulator